jgi:hypothetical protein
MLSLSYRLRTWSDRTAATGTHPFWTTGLLVLPGLITALGFTLLASRRWGTLDASLAVFIIIFAQWQMLGVTVAKLGIDQVVFAAVTADESIYFGARSHLLCRVLPVTVAFSSVVALVFSPWAGVAAFVTLMLDAHSTMLVADLNARKSYRATVIANLLNYPLFFALLFACALSRALTAEASLGLFVLASLTRWLWLRGQTANRADRRRVTCNVSGAMGAQQVLNYLAFRIDQVILPVIGVMFGERFRGAEFMNQYLFLAKFPELFSSMVVILGTVLLPRVFIRDASVSLARHAWEHRRLLAVLLLITMGALAVYAATWNGRRIPVVAWLPFFCHALLVLPVNICTYSMLRHNHVGGLLRNLSVSSLVGMSLVTALGLTGQVALLGWVVPAQLALLIGFTYLLSWGKKSDVYV